MDFWQLVVLGAIAGFTLFLGLPFALLHNVSRKKKGFLNAFAMGILIFLIIDVFSHAWETASSAASDAGKGKVATGDAVLDLLALFGGLGIGLLSLVWYESRYMSKSTIPKSGSAPAAAEQLSPASASPMTGSRAAADSGTAGGLAQQQQEHHLIQVHAYKVAMMIAIGIGAHNFSEGLAIGQSYASGAIGLAIILIIGFGSHNATEGFGITGPLHVLAHRPKIRFLIIAGIVGAAPTFVGTIIGSLWVSDVASIFFLSLAGGALVYVTMLMYNSGRRQTTNAVLMVGIFVGMCAGFITDLIVTLGGA